MFSSWVSLDDYVRASRALTGRWSNGMTSICTMLGTFAVMLLLLREPVGALLMVVLLGLVVGQHASARGVRSNLNGRDLPASHTLTVMPDAVHYAEELASTEWRWQAIRRLVVTPDQVVFESRRGGGSFINRRGADRAALRQVVELSHRSGVDVSGSL